MTDRMVGHEEGVATDSDHTVICHQITSVEGNILRYSAIAPELSRDVPKDAIINLNGLLAEPKLKTDAKVKTQAQREYDRIVGGFREVEKIGFSFKEERPALTYDIGFDDNYNITSIGYRATMAIMTEKIDQKEAKRRTKENPVDHGLLAWHNVMARYRAILKGHHQAKEITFDKVIAYTTDLVRKANCQINVAKNVGTIYQIFDTKKESQLNQFHGNTLDFYRDCELYGEEIRSAVVSGTAARNTVSCINIETMRHNCATGADLLPATALTAIADYKNFKLNYC